MKRSLQKAIVKLPTQSPPPDETSLSTATVKVLREANTLRKTMHDAYIAQDHILLALFKDPSIQVILKENNLNEATLKTAVEQIRGNRRVESKTAEQGFDALQKYAIDLTALAEEGKIDPVIGRDNEIRRAIRILCRRSVHFDLCCYHLSIFLGPGRRIIPSLSVNLVLVRPPLLKVLLSESSNAMFPQVSLVVFGHWIWALSWLAPNTRVNMKNASKPF